MFFNGDFIIYNYGKNINDVRCEGFSCGYI